MKIKNQLLLTVLLLSCLTFSSCSSKKPNAINNEDNPFGTTSTTKSQILQPCHWSFTVEQGTSGEAILTSTAKLDSGWHLYSQHIPGKGPRSKFVYDVSSTYQLLGDTEETKPSQMYDPYLEMQVLYFEKAAVFKQKIKVLSKVDFTITGTIDYMTCLTQCVKSDEEFSFKVKVNP
jgi:thiol:disulfide interchange protein DsbD